MKARILSALLLLTLCAVGAQAKPPKKKHPAVKPAPATAPADKAEAAAPPEGPAKPDAKPEVPVVPGLSTPEAVAAGVQAFYDKQPGFQAHFTQVVKKKGLSAGIQREGTVWLQKGDAVKQRPGKMRWDYPTEEIFYFSNGEVLWSYEKRERLAIRVPIKNSQLYQATTYLLGQGNLAKDFKLSLVTSPLPDAVALQLVPRAGTQVMRSLTLYVDKKTFAVRGSMLVDPLGDSTTLQWTGAAYEAVDDKVFEWSPPPGVQVKNL